MKREVNIIEKNIAYSTKTTFTIINYADGYAY